MDEAAEEKERQNQRVGVSTSALNRASGRSLRLRESLSYHIKFTGFFFIFLN